MYITNFVRERLDRARSHKCAFYVLDTSPKNVVCVVGREDGRTALLWLSRDEINKLYRAVNSEQSNYHAGIDPDEVPDV